MPLARRALVPRARFVPLLFGPAAIVATVLVLAGCDLRFRVDLNRTDCAPDGTCPPGFLCDVSTDTCRPSMGDDDDDDDDDVPDCPTPERLCSNGRICCGEGEECVDGFQCLPVCETVRCGDNGTLCCGDAQVCLDGVVCAADCPAEQALCGSAFDVCCPAGDVCVDDACQTPGAPCGDDFDCLTEGTYCEPTIGRCLPIPDLDPPCEIRPEFDQVAPVVEWHWAGVDLDGGALWANVGATPMVGDVSGDGIPDVVVPVYRTDALDNGILVGLNGRPDSSDGELLFYVDGADRPQGVSPVALGNLDGDPALEVVYRVRSGGVRIVDIDMSEPDLGARAKTVPVRDDAGEPTGDLQFRNSGFGMSVRGAPALADLNQDGTPDVVIGCHALDGRDISDPSLDFFDYGNCIFDNDYSHVAVADLDGDGLPEVTSGAVALNAVPQGEESTVLWGQDSNHRVPAVADLDLDGTPEVIGVRGGNLIVRAGNDGTMLIGPGGAWADGTFAIPGGGVGGPPTVADFDGDGRPEIAAAGRAAYAVYDPDCLPAGDDPTDPDRLGTEDPANCEDGFLRWTAATQDISSSVTGSSVFDFQGDGRAEVVYNDECFLHVYDGTTGAGVLAETIYNTSRTVTEYPIVVDVDRDGNSEFVVPANNDKVGRDGCIDLYRDRLGLGADDPLPPEVPENGTQGIFVFGDLQDRWVRTRPVWNQYTYHVTNVTDRGEIPTVEPDNWDRPGLNNYRTNVQGDGVFNVPNLTVSLVAAGECAGRRVRLSAVVVNAGSRGVPPGISLSFFQSTDGEAEVEVADAATTRPLLPGGSERVTVTIDDLPAGVDLLFRVAVDGGDGASPEDSAVPECIEDDNEATGTERCPVLR
ncbi:MAG TPA: VCBS repeat-containing protein [Polyangiaceae bacterium LLY-WYZ-14_1]|nr:VCBS repeat-containing protein [Polyangiaceae bacterium LLY-WYZ-14_1]